MKKIFKLLGLFALVTVIGFSMTACGNGTGGVTYSIGDTGPGGGKVFYDKGSYSDGWRYLEAAPENVATSLTWCSCTSAPWCNVSTGTAIGTGKANTAAIISAHSSDTADNNAAKACAEYSNNSKKDWFLPSKDELYEMFNARTQVGISSGSFWSSSQDDDWGDDCAWKKDFYNPGWSSYYKNSGSYVRAVRAF